MPADGHITVGVGFDQAEPFEDDVRLNELVIRRKAVIRDDKQCRVAGERRLAEGVPDLLDAAVLESGGLVRGKCLRPEEVLHAVRRDEMHEEQVGVLSFRAENRRPVHRADRGGGRIASAIPTYQAAKCRCRPAKVPWTKPGVVYRTCGSGRLESGIIQSSDRAPFVQGQMTAAVFKPRRMGGIIQRRDMDRLLLGQFRVADVNDGLPRTPIVRRYWPGRRAIWAACP